MVNIDIPQRTPTTATTTATTSDMCTDIRGLATRFAGPARSRRADDCHVVALVERAAVQMLTSQSASPRRAR
jgi:hypothetical protein